VPGNEKRGPLSSIQKLAEEIKEIANSPSLGSTPTQLKQRIEEASRIIQLASEIQLEALKLLEITSRYFATQPLARYPFFAYFSSNLPAQRIPSPCSFPLKEDRLSRPDCRGHLMTCVSATKNACPDNVRMIL